VPPESRPGPAPEAGARHVEGNRETVGGRVQGRGAEGERIAATVGDEPLVHHPGPAFGTRERHVQGTERQRIGLPGGAGAGRRVGRREDAADEGDHGQRRAAVVRDDVGVEPEVPVVRGRQVEGRSAQSASAARCPLAVAIGSPAPGCTVPPARYRPRKRVRAPGLRKA
jgi:hypothetical protein